MFQRRHRSTGGRASGFTLIELLIVVAIIGIIAAVAIPNLLNALDRGRQKRSMADIRSVASLIEMYGIDNSYFPIGGDLTTLRTILEPMYAKAVPTQDGWNNDILAVSLATGYTITSHGKDGTGGATACAGSPTCALLNDSIIYSNGQFVQYPAGPQR